MEDGAEQPVLRLGALPGAAPDRWAARWRDRHPEVRLQIDHFDEDGQVRRVRDGVVDVGYLRVPAQEDRDVVDRDVFHRVWLYREHAVVCAARDHWVAAAEESVTWDDIGDETFLEPAEVAAGAPGPPAGDEPPAELARAERMTLEVVASGAGLLVLPLSTARALSRKDVVVRRIEDHPGFDVGLCWLRERDDDVIQEFIGVTRGRRADSARSTLEPTEGTAPGASARRGAAKGGVAKPNSGKRDSGRRGSGSARTPRRRSGGPGRRRR
ncbi:MAG: LysR family transcriptional regulator substrate-binding protein [Nesterenkonia sp.]|nr:LysR family transcriptional regulator substrate-binding protein [Nesterenkonia sp.]